MGDFTLAGAIHSAQAGRIDEWVNDFLLGPGNNEAMAVGLGRAERYWIGPIRLPLARLERCCGPEPHMEYREEVPFWNQRVVGFLEALESGVEFPPLIAEYREGRLSVRDGSHRLGALVEANHEWAWTLVWHNTEADFDRHERSLLAAGIM